MLIYLLRHGPAGERDPARYPDDDLRPLTDDGRRRTESVARGIAALGLRMDHILSSPLVRARQTADLAARHLKFAARQIVETPSLAPESPPADGLGELATLDIDASTLLVGHEPHLSQLLSLLVAGRTDAVQTDFKKAGLAGVECDDVVSAGRGVLQFLLKPGQLVQMAD